MAKLHEISLSVNGHQIVKSIPATMTLLDFLREELNLTGAKRGCDLGECGCCTVLVNQRPLLSCLMLALEADGKEITTIEGVAQGNQLHPVQEAFIEEGALQCGYCTPAMILNGIHLLQEKPKATLDEIKERVSATLCRCTGYTKVEKALARARDTL